MTNYRCHSPFLFPINRPLCPPTGSVSRIFEAQTTPPTTKSPDRTGYVSMGIQGLLPLLKSIHIKAHLSEFGGQRYIFICCVSLSFGRSDHFWCRIAVDGYVWLHRGAYACAQEVVKGKRTVKFVSMNNYLFALLTRCLGMWTTLCIACGCYSTTE